MSNFNPVDTQQLSKFYNRDDQKVRNIAFTQAPKKRAGQLTLTEMIPAMKRTVVSAANKRKVNNALQNFK